MTFLTLVLGTKEGGPQWRAILQQIRIPGQYSLMNITGSMGFGAATAFNHVTATQVFQGYKETPLWLEIH